MTPGYLRPALQSLVGRSLRTLDRRNPFTTEVVSDAGLEIRRWQSGGTVTVRWNDLEQVRCRLRSRGQLTREAIHREVPTRVLSCIAALLAEIPGVQHTLGPITLRLRAKRKLREHRRPTSPPKPRESRTNGSEHWQ